MIRTKEVEDFIETWARYCGAPKSVFIGHLDKMLESVVKDHESRISSLEAALSLDDENVERVAGTFYEKVFHKPFSKASSIARESFLEEAAYNLSVFRKLAGLEGEDGE